MQEIRRAVYLIIICNAIVRHVIFSCIRCRSMRRRFGEQMMADLPKDCVRKAPSFTYCGFDLFGPFLVKERWSELKRYEALFTWLVSRAVHIEFVATMETDTFITAFWRMIARRGNIKSMRSDNGINFVRTENGKIKGIPKKGISRNETYQNQAFFSGKWSRLAGLDQNTPSTSQMGGGMGVTNKITEKHFVITTQNSWNKLEWWGCYCIDDRSLSSA